MATNFPEASQFRPGLWLHAVLDTVSGEAPFRWSIEDFVVRLLAPGVALTTYRLSVGSVEGTDVRTTLRSSVWVQRGGRWMMVFHQGTPVAAEEEVC